HDKGPAGRVKLLPMTAGSIVLSYNLPGVKGPIRLSREAYLGIFERKITRWNHPEIVRLNTDAGLTDLPITVVTRADSSGTTDVFTNHLKVIGGKVKNDEGKEVDRWTAVGKSVNWPNKRQSDDPGSLIAGQGNDGVAALIQMTPGSIGYLEFGYARLGNLPMAELENKAR